MRTVSMVRRRYLWFSLAAILTFLLAACGTGTGTGAGPTPTPTYPTVNGYGTTYGCPSDAVVNPAPSTPNVIVNVNQSHSTVTAHTNDVIEVHLPFGQVWRGPTASQGVLQLQTPFGYALKDKSVCVWRFVAQGTGTTQLAFTAKALCKPGQLCPQYILNVPFTISVQ